ncbi:reverse transcriptase domain-containing protein [Tanacetum coccineum]
MVPAITSLTGFSRETIWPLGQLRLLVTIGDANYSTKAWMNFMIVRSPSQYNGIIGRPEIIEVQVVPSTTHEMIKFPMNCRIVTIRSTILTPTKCATIAATPKDTEKKAETRHENFKAAIHPNFPDQEIAIGGALSAKGRTELCSLLKENLDIFAWQPFDMTRVPRTVILSQRLIGKSSPYAAILLNASWTHTKATIKYRWQKQMKKRWLSIPLRGYIATPKCPSASRMLGLRRNLKVYVDDLVIKSHTKTELLRDIEETLRTLRKINMKLNPKKCTFGAGEGMFLGYMIGLERIKTCPDKVDVVLQLPSPRTIKEAQSLNGKLAGLNRFLSKSAEKSLSLFKTLKKCTKKSDFHFTSEAEQAFKHLKQHISELPMLVEPRPKEELIMYLSASHGVVGAVLMTERDTIQTLVYFVSWALQGVELNYTPMEKLILALVCAAKRLRRYFHAHHVAVIMDQPIKQIISCPDVAGRLQKWSIMLGEHNIRTSVKGQILADFLVEKSDEVPANTSVKEVPQEPWTLFTDGSSCVDGSGAGLILTSPEGTEFTYALRFQFVASNNEAEYEALIAGLRIAAQMGVRKR